MAQHDFTKGSIRRQMIVFAGPIILTNLLQVSYQFIDSLWVGNLIGDEALGAVTIAATIIVTVLAFIIGINNATLTILSQLKGRDDNQGLVNYVNAFVVILSIFSVLLGLFGFLFSKNILSFFNTPPEMLDAASTYLQINFLGILLLMGYNFIGTALRSLGDSKTPLRFVFIAVVLNTILDPIFIAVFNWEIAGAAWATIVSQGTAFLLALIYTLRKKVIPFTVPKLPKKEEVWLIFKLGIPAGLQMMVIHAGVMAILSVVNSFGGAVVAGYGASQRIDSLIILPAMALGTAVNAMAGQNIAVNRWDRVRQIAIYGTIYNFVIMIIVATVVFVLANMLTKLFLNETEAIQYGTDYLKIITYFYPFIGLNFILNGIVRGSGAMYQVLILNIISFWVLRYPLAYFCSSIMGANGIPVGIGISFLISSIFAFLYFQWGGWKKKRLFSS